MITRVTRSMLLACALAFGAGSVAGTCAGVPAAGPIDRVASAPAGPSAHGGPGRTVSLSGFDPSAGWQGGGALDPEHAFRGRRALGVTIPPNGSSFLTRNLPLGLDDGAWDLVLWLRTDTPQNLGRVSLMARSGLPNGLDDTIASASGFRSGWNRVVFPRTRFFQHWFSHFQWSAARAIAVRIEANSNGPAVVTLGGIDIAPAGPAPLLIEQVAVAVGDSTSAEVTCETEIPTSLVLDYGPTPAYGSIVHERTPTTSHVFPLGDLAPFRKYHARIRTPAAEASSGTAGGATGDFSFSTVPVVLPAAAANAAPERPFDLGLYGVRQPIDLRHAAALHFPLCQSYRLSSDSGNTSADARRYLDRAEAAGIRVVAGFDAARVKSGDLAYVRARVGALRGHPALRGWYEFDEPEQHDVSPDTLAAVYRTIRAEDPGHPVYLAASRLDASYPYRSACDVAILDRYPIPFRPADSIVPALERARQSGTTFQFAFQAYAVDLDHRWPASRLGPARYPTRDEMRAMAFLALDHGATGLWAFSYDYLTFTLGSEWKWVELGELARELRGLGPMLGSADASMRGNPAASRVAIDVAMRSYGGDDYLIAVNRSDAEVDAELWWTGPAAASVVRVDLDRAQAGTGSSTLRATPSRIADHWTPLAVHVYRISGH